MELAFIYIEHHKVLNDINCNINSGFKGEFRNGVLAIEAVGKDSEYYSGVQISAVVGKNGVGKSTLLDFVEALYDDKNESSGLIVWFDKMNDKYHICTSNFYIDLKVSSIDREYKFYRDSSSEFIRENNVNIVKINNLSSMGELRSLSSAKNKHIHDYSLSSRHYNSNSKLKKRMEKFMCFFSSSYSIFGGKRDRIEFIFEFSSSSVSLVKSIIKDKERLKYIGVKEKDVEKLEYFLTLYLDDNEIRIDKFLNDSSDVNRFLVDTNILGIIGYSVGLKFKERKDKELVIIHLLLKYIDGEFSKNEIIELFEDYTFELVNGVVSGGDGISVAIKIDEIFKSIDRISSVLKHNRRVIGFKHKGAVTVDDVGIIQELMTEIERLPSIISKNFKFGWNGLSTGEFAKINLFAELYSYLFNLNGDIEGSHLIFMDEVDLYLHPEWQRSFLSELLLLVNSLYVDDDVQFVLTSHSPIIIGDFLPEDILSFEKNNEGFTVVVPSYGFGTRIVDLFLTGMHLESTFGEHSRGMIEGMQDRSSTNDLTGLDKSRISKIPDKNIQNMLLGKYD
jgi:predicted ATPase